MRAIIAIAAVCLLAGHFSAYPATADEKAGTIKVTLVGPDGKPASGTEWRRVPLDDSYFSPQKTSCEVWIVDAYDGNGNGGRTIVYVPDGKETEVIVPVRVDADFDRGERLATEGKKFGDADRQQRGYEEAKEALAQLETDTKAIKAAVEAWARDNDLPDMSLSSVKKQAKLAEKLGDQNKDQADKLKSYQAKLEKVQNFQEGYEERKARCAELSPPDPSVSAVPGACPEGQSGGLLAGLLNDVTGTNSFSGICDDKEKQKDNRDRQRDHKNRHGDDRE